ncbi:MAG: 4Fe-4S binding protein [Rhizobiaceae bacterium]
MRLVSSLSLIVLFVLAFASAANSASGFGEPLAATAPDAAMAARLMGVAGPVTVTRQETGVPGWSISSGGETIGHVGSTWEIARSVGYSGRPLEVLVGIDMQAKIAGAILVHHNEPVLTLGISDKDIETYVSGFAGHDLRRSAGASEDDLPAIISRATVSTGVIRDGILRTARTLAAGRDLIDVGGGLDRLGYRPLDWSALLASGALTEASITIIEAALAFAKADLPVEQGPGDFIHVWTGLVDPPTVGQNLLGQQEFTRAIGSLGPNETSLIVISSGLYSHRGTDWRRSGVFERVAVVQGSIRHVPTESAFQMVKRLRIEGAPQVREISLFRLPGSLDPLKPFTIEIVSERKSGDTAIKLVLDAQYSLPEAFRTAAMAEDEPLWKAMWAQSQLKIAVVAALLLVLGLVFFAQEWITHRPGLWRSLRTGFLLFTLFVLGWGLNGQLSIVQVIAFLHSLLGGFRWETFLIEPVIFLLWGFVALGLLFWGRGVYCGWLCPFGALQELLNLSAVRLGVRQVQVPQALHERLWIFKYTAFVGIVALSFYSMHDSLVMAEIEPFKTAISLRFMRAWPFLLFVGVLLFAGLFIERFYCRYLCPLGAGLAIPSKLKVFDWLHRRPQCGRECRLCETKCTVGAIDTLGRINANECVLCLRCQVIMNDASQCTVLKRRATRTMQVQP